MNERRREAGRVARLWAYLSSCRRGVSSWCAFGVFLRAGELRVCLAWKESVVDRRTAVVDVEKQVCLARQLTEREKRESQREVQRFQRARTGSSRLLEIRDI